MPATYHHPACLDDAALLRQCTVRTGRAGGPGGQHRNKVETHVMVTHTATGLIGQAGERRSQVENKHVALQRLRLHLAIEYRTIPPAPPKPRGHDAASLIASLDGVSTAACSDLWRSRVRGGRMSCNPDHHDFPCLLAEAMDHIAAAGWEEKPAAGRLGLTVSQLVRFVKDCPEAMAVWNRQRSERGMHGLK